MYDTSLTVESIEQWNAENPEDCHSPWMGIMDDEQETVIIKEGRLEFEEVISQSAKSNDDVVIVTEDNNIVVNEQQIENIVEIGENATESVIDNIDVSTPSTSIAFTIFVIALSIIRR